MKALSLSLLGVVALLAGCHSGPYLPQDTTKYTLENTEKFVVMDKKVVSPEQLFEMIKKDGYTGGPIRLFSCETGQVVPLKGYGPSVEPVASKLAQLTKNEVIAPIDTVKVARDGGLGWKNPEYVRDQPGPGWQTFKP